MRIGLFYESSLRPLVERVESALRTLGHEVEADYRHQDEIDKLSWAIVMDRVFSSCDAVIGLQTVDGLLNEDWRGIKEEQALFEALRKPKATTFSDMLSGESDEALIQQCDTLVEYLRHQGAQE